MQLLCYKSYSENELSTFTQLLYFSTTLQHIHLSNSISATFSFCFTPIQGEL